jgi:hypothetical protein
MGMGDIFQRGIELYQRGFVILVAVAAVVQVPLAIVSAVLGKRVADAFAPLIALGQNPSPTDFGTTLQKALQDAGPSLSTIGVVGFVAGLLLSPALIATVARLNAGSTPSIPEAYGKSLAAAPSILIGSIVQGIVLTLLFFAVLVVGIVIAVVFQDSPGLVAFAIFAAVIVAIVATAYIAVRWSVWSVAVVLEGRGPLDALGRSWRLVRGSMWRTVALLFVTGLVASVAGALFGAVGGAIGGAINDGVGRFVSEALSVLTVSWVPIVLTLLFLDLRGRESRSATAASPPEATWPANPEPPSAASEETPPSES